MKLAAQDPKFHSFSGRAGAVCYIWRYEAIMLVQEYWPLEIFLWQEDNYNAGSRMLKLLNLISKISDTKDNQQHQLKKCGKNNDASNHGNSSKTFNKSVTSNFNSRKNINWPIYHQGVVPMKLHCMTIYSQSPEHTATSWNLLAWHVQSVMTDDSHSLCKWLFLKRCYGSWTFRQTSA